MSGTSGPGRLTPAEAFTGVASSTPPVADQRVRSALAVCEEGKFMVYTGTGGPLSGYLTAAQAVARADAEGLTYFGTVHDWIWIIDVDDPTCDAYRTLLAMLESLEIEHVVVDSGRGRHVYVHLAKEDVERNRIWEELRRCHPQLDRVHQIDPRSSGSIRPVLAPPKVGSEHGPAMPEIDLEEALEKFENWRSTSAPHSSALPPQRSLAALPEWAQAYLRQDWEKAHKLGKPPKIASQTGAPDRSWVDFEIALAYRNAGLGLTDYLAARQPGGTHPSPKATEKGPKGLMYLERQWSDAMALPGRSVVSSADVEYLDAFLADVEASALKANQKRVIAFLAGRAREFGKVIIGLDQRTIAAGAGVGRQVLKSMFDDAAVTRYVVKWNPEAEQDCRTKSDVYQLQIEDRHRVGNQIHTIWGSALSGCGSGIPLPPPHHPVFIAAGLRQRARDVLSVLGNEPINRVEVYRRLKVAGIKIDRKTVYRTLDNLVGMTVLTEVEGRYLIDTDLDWNRLAHEMGAFEGLDRQAERILHNRVERQVSLEHRESPERHQSRTGEPYTPDETAAWVDELRAKIEREFAQRQQRVVKSAVRWGAVDPHTGELIPYSAVPARESNSQAVGAGALVVIRCPLLPGRSPEARPPADRPVTVRTHAHSPVSGLCVACGLPCHQHHAIGLRLHGYCRVPHWMARMYEHRGQPIPPHQILPKPAPPVDPYEIDRPLDHYRRQVAGNAA